MLLREAKQRLEEGNSLHLIAQVFTEISSSKLKRIRRGIEENRYFYYDLSNIYSLINMIALKNNITRRAKYNKTAAILVGSNERFYGQITNMMINFFISQIGGKNYDLMVVGKSNHAALEGLNFHRPYRKIVFKKDLPEREEIQAVTAQIKDYTQVLVYYPQMKSVLVQIPVSKDITQTSELASYGGNKEQMKAILGQLDYLLEPDIRNMIQFFDTQIKGLLLEQTLMEAELARTASRLITMDHAQNEAEDYIKQMQGEVRRSKKNAANAKIIEAVSVLELVKGKING